MGYLDERAKWEKQYWSRLMARCRNNVTRAARESGCNRQGIYKILQRLGLRPAKSAKAGRGGNAAWHSLEN